MRVRRPDFNQRFLTPQMLAVAASLCLGLMGCGGSSDDDASGGAAGAGTGGASGAGGVGATGGVGSGGVSGGSGSGGAGGATNCVQSDSSSTIPGVSIDILPQRCTFTLAEAAKGLTFVYEVKAEKEILDFTPSPQDAGQCGTPDSSGLILFERLSGGGEGYCLCDEGLCSGTPIKSTVKVTNYGTKFVWDGVNWNGPSDTGNPKGAPFPAGTYTLEVSTRGKLSGSTTQVEASAKFPITLVP